jgi:hypothetical protein
VDGELFWRYQFVACKEHEHLKEPRAAFERHRLKGDKERAFSELLSDFDLHRPPCKSLIANNAYYLLGALAYNILQALKVIYLPPEHQPKRIRTLLHHLLLILVEIKRHARGLNAVFFSPRRLGATSAIYGGSMTDILRGALIGGITGAITAGTGSYFDGALSAGSALSKAVAHGLVQGAASEVTGGDFGSGFIGGGSRIHGGFSIRLGWIRRRSLCNCSGKPRGRRNATSDNHSCHSGWHTRSDRRGQLCQWRGDVLLCQAIPLLGAGDQREHQRTHSPVSTQTQKHGGGVEIVKGLEIAETFSAVLVDGFVAGRIGQARLEFEQARQ